MYIAYVDDSGSTGSNLDDLQSTFQVVGGPLVRDSEFTMLELGLSSMIARLVPEEQWDSFEFHASDLFHANKPFDVLGPEKCRELLQQALSRIHFHKFPILYGAVNKIKLQAQPYGSANPLDMAFRIYLDSLQNWFGKIYFSERPNPNGILIVDDSSKTTRSSIEKTFRQRRKRKVAFPGTATGLSVFLLDEVYFGDSKSSIGIQVADICVYFIARHLAQKPDSEGFYNIIKDQIVYTEVLPEDESKVTEIKVQPV